MTKAMLVAQFLRERAWWRLDSAGASAVHVARSVVCLLDAAAYLEDVPDFAPGPEGAVLIREWQLADLRSAGPADLLAQLAQLAQRAVPTAEPRVVTPPAPRRR